MDENVSTCACRATSVIINAAIFTYVKKYKEWRRLWEKRIMQKRLNLEKKITRRGC